MDSCELMSSFVALYVADDRKERWLELAKKRGAVFKKLIQLERHLNEQCVRFPWSEEAFLLEFVERYRPVWLWDFHPDDPLQLRSVENARTAVNGRRAFLAISGISNHALYFNGDCDYWVCGGWKK